MRFICRAGRTCRRPAGVGKNSPYKNSSRDSPKCTVESYTLQENKCADFRGENEGGGKCQKDVEKQQIIWNQNQPIPLQCTPLIRPSDLRPSELCGQSSG